MKAFEDLTDARIKDSWVTIGSFDGVHIGHQKLIIELVHAAHLAGELATVVTFFPNPAVSINNIQTPYYLCTPLERNALLAEFGIDIVVALKFDRKMAQQGAEEFISELKQQLGMKELWVGGGFTLGKNGEGNAAVLSKLSKKFDFHFKQIDTLQSGESPISSSRIRTLLAEGDPEAAAKLLGRPYRMTGRVIHGESRGKKLGSPTANLEVWNKQVLPRNGIYATWVWWLRKRYPSVTNVGVSPTFKSHDQTPTIEPHIIGFDQDLYGQSLTVEFLKYLRPEQKFSSVDLLKRQIQKDIVEAQEVFANAPKTPGLPARSKKA